MFSKWATEAFNTDIESIVAAIASKLTDKNRKDLQNRPHSLIVHYFFGKYTGGTIVWSRKHIVVDVSSKGKRLLRVCQSAIAQLWSKHHVTVRTRACNVEERWSAKVWDDVMLWCRHAVSTKSSQMEILFYFTWRNSSSCLRRVKRWWSDESVMDIFALSGFMHNHKPWHFNI